MNYVVQRGKVRQQVINVPEGLPEMLEDISKEVLRCQPTSECLVQFIIDYMHSVLETRQKAQMAKAIIERALRKVNEVILDICVCEIPEKKAEELALAMEECFKRFLQKRRCDRRKQKEIVKFDEWDMLDVLIEKCRFSEHDLAMARPFIEDAYNRFVEAYKDAAETLDGIDALYEYFQARELKRLEGQRMLMAATKIQAAFRGFSARKKLICDTMIPNIDDVVFEYYMDEDKVVAAIRIQRYWREYRAKCEDNFDVTYCVEEENFDEKTSSDVCSPKTLSSEVLTPPAKIDMPAPVSMTPVVKEEKPAKAPAPAPPEAPAEEAAPPPDAPQEEAPAAEEQPPPAPLEEAPAEEAAE